MTTGAEMASGLHRTGDDIELGPYPGDRVAEGEPASGIVPLGEWRGVEVGVWECTPGSFTDVEADELFVVLSGTARIEFVEPAAPAIEIGPGDVVRLDEGMSTVWTVHQTIRKVYLG